MPTDTFYSIAEGSPARTDKSESWHDIRYGAGTYIYTRPHIFIQAHATDTDMWDTVVRGVMAFDTSSLPDGATISAAILSLYGRTKADTLGLSPSIKLYSIVPVYDQKIDGQTFMIGDYELIGGAGASDAITYAAWSTSGYNDFTLNVLGRLLINKAGQTYFAIREVDHDAGGGVPTWSADDYSIIEAYKTADGDAYRPKLVVTYATVIPEVTTDAATDIAATSFTANGTIDNTGGENCDERGFEWGKTPGVPLTNSWTETDSFGTGAFTHGVTGLDSGEVYYYRAKAHNSAGWGYGAVRTVSADGGVVHPTNPLLRASGITRTFWAGTGGQSVYQAVITLGGISTSYVSPIGSREPESAVTPTPEVRETYDRWLNYYITYNLAGLLKTFGHIPTFEEWLEWIKQGGAP